MNSNMNVSADESGRKRISFSQDKDGVNKRVEVEQVENGWIMTVNKEYTMGEGEKKEWKYECKRYISKSNPLEKKKKNESEDIMNLFDSVFGNGNMITVD